MRFDYIGQIFRKMKQVWYNMDRHCCLFLTLAGVPDLFELFIIRKQMTIS